MIRGDDPVDIFDRSKPRASGDDPHGEKIEVTAAK